jgi:hypothetical protein
MVLDSIWSVSGDVPYFISVNGNKVEFLEFVFGILNVVDSDIYLSKYLGIYGRDYGYLSEFGKLRNSFFFLG